jgi:hypothetical protein
MPDPNDIPRRRRVLVLDVTQAAAEVSRLIHSAHDLNLPVEPGVRDGRDAWSAGPSCSRKSSRSATANRIPSVTSRPGVSGVSANLLP